MNKTLTDMLNISSNVPVPQQEILPVIHQEKSDDADFEEDFSLVRENLKDLVQKGVETLDGIASIADSSMQPRAYEIAATTLKTLADANLQLLDIHDKRKKMKESKKADSSSPSTVNNTLVFSGTAAEMLKNLNK